MLQSHKKLEQSWWEALVWSLKKSQTVDLLELWPISDRYVNVNVNKKNKIPGTERRPSTGLQELWMADERLKHRLQWAAGGCGTSFWSASFLPSDISDVRVQVVWMFLTRVVVVSFTARNEKVRETCWPRCLGRWVCSGWARWKHCRRLWTLHMLQTHTQTICEKRVSIKAKFALTDILTLFCQSYKLNRTVWTQFSK